MPVYSAEDNSKFIGLVDTSGINHIVRERKFNLIKIIYFGIFFEPKGGPMGDTVFPN